MALPAGRKRTGSFSCFFFRPTTKRVTTTAAQQDLGGQESFNEVMSNIMSALAALQQNPSLKSTIPGADLWVNNLNYHPPGAPDPLLQNVSLHVPPNSLGLIFGRSGAGKTTVLQLIAGLQEPNSGSISFLNNGLYPLSAQERMNQAGIVFQFPERHFIGATLAEELTAGWPSPDTVQGMAARQNLAVRASQVLQAVGLDSLPITTKLSALSDGYKRRVALAVQLVRRPRLLLLDEPLAGLDWKTRADLVRLLGSLKTECTVLVVSHDLREIADLADVSYRMRPGGVLVEEALPVRG